MRLTLGAMLLVLAGAGTARADTVTFKNGDKLTGTLVSVRDGSIALKSDALGDVSIPLAKVETFSVEKPVVLLGKQTELARGQASLDASGNWVVTSNGSSQNVSAANVGTILPADTYHSLAEEHPKPWQEWKGAASLGFSLQHGDQQAHSIAVTVAATRDRPAQLPFVRHFRTTYGLTMLFATAKQGATSVTSDTLTTALREDFFLSERNFVFGLGELDHIQPEGLYLRQTAGGGAGRDVIHNSRTILSAFGGVNYVHERFIGGVPPSDSSVQALVGEKLGLQISSRARLDEQADFYPDLRRGNHYRGDTSAVLAFRLNNRLTVNAGLIDLFLGAPPPGSRSNNIAVTTGLGYTF